MPVLENMRSTDCYYGLQKANWKYAAFFFSQCSWMTLKGNISSVLNMPVVSGIPYSERCYPANSPYNRWPIFVKLVQSGHHLRQTHLSTLVIQMDLNCTGPNF